MLELVKKSLCGLVLAGGALSAGAFSLIGPFDTWQVNTIGYQLGGDIGGPQNLGEEYRWNTPVIVYGFDSSFLDYFGARGVEAIERQIENLNKLPAFSEMSRDLSEFPIDTRRFNYKATALGIVDLGSYALASMVEQLGLAASERYVWTLRSRTATPDPLIFNYVTIKRNFDPITYEPSSYVNGTLYTYQIMVTGPGPIVEAVEVVVDPLAPSVTAVSALADGGGSMDLRGTITLKSDGMFYTGLTRDDVGGLRYLYSKSNINTENLATNVVGGAFGGGGGTPLSGDGGSFSWWTPVSGGTPQQGGGGAAVGGGGATGGTGTNGVAVVVTAPRPGVDKLRFVRSSFDSAYGQFVTNFVVYTDTFLTNSTLRQQVVSKVVVQPDIVFSASDLGVNAAGVPLRLTRTAGFVNNSGITGIGGRAGLNGPGQISGLAQITFSKIGPWFFNVSETTEETATKGFAWGSFDGSTNAPVVYPSGTSIRDLEARLFQGGQSPFAIGQ
jgi:hypothetical protein